MADLLSSLILTPLASRTPSPDVSDLTSSLLSSYPLQKTLWRNPYYPIHGHSPLQAEYIVPNALPDERNGEATSPLMYRDSSTPLSQEPTSSSASHDSLTTEAFESLEVEQGDTGYRGPAANLVASRLPRVEADKMAQRREIEDVYSIRNILNKNRQWEDRMAVLLGEMMLANGINRHLGAIEVGYLPEDEHTMGKGTVGTNGHRRMHEFLHSKEKKRKRSVEDIGDEITDDKSTKRTPTVPPCILRMHAEKKYRHLPSRHTG
ncbi:uncharacterized protein J4E88_004487 [Alternaria novae-zelandiae]|uniref:uncharacterized protein n=1 Tax=Alternaria novae-zelandiae TaxID=430562 RepID=UPI0020C30240|nr:uncharacterized protein J4E88_004487 [Alternaria novae-zelandiae]KAI4685044.1 hypothetical protein J4E88_004487 [Alternaria novae-zelandiae]